MYTSFSSNGSIWLVTQGEYLSFLLAYLPRKQIVKDLKIIELTIISMKYEVWHYNAIQEDCYHAACRKHDETLKSKHLSKNFQVRKQKKETKWHTLKLRWRSIINCSWQLDMFRYNYWGSNRDRRSSSELLSFRCVLKWII